MSKKKSKSPSSSSSKPAQPARQRKTSPSRGVSKAQKEMLETLREEILDFREIALIVMSDDGILPPLYGGDYLSGEDDPANPIDRREVISLWDIGEDSTELAAALFRVIADTEPNAELRQIRDELEMVNDWPLSELLDMMVTAEGESMIQGGEDLRKLSMMVALFGSQIKPAPGYDRETMLDYMSNGEPYAVFIHVPTTVEDDTLTYRWDDLEQFSAEVVYAPSPQLLEAAVWEYCLNLGLAAERKLILEVGGDVEEELGLENAAEWSCLFELYVLQSLRFYGTTSPVRARQAELDFIREENNDLVIKFPVKPEVEPLPVLADYRKDALAEPAGQEFIRLEGSSEMMQQVWPTIRASDFYSVRMRSTTFVEGTKGQLHLGANVEHTFMDWYMADSLPELYLQVRLVGIFELLGLSNLILTRIKNFE